MKNLFSALISILICLAMIFSMTSCLGNSETPDEEITDPDGSENTDPEGGENANPEGGENTNPEGGENTTPEDNKSPSDDMDDNGWTKL